MSMQPRQLKELFELLNALREDTITDKQFEKLDEILGQSEQAGRIYVDYVKLCAELRNFQSAVVLGDRLSVKSNVSFRQEEILSEDVIYSNLWNALAENELNAEGIEVEKPVVKSEPVVIKRKEDHVKLENKISRFALITAISSIAALVIILAYVYMHPKQVQPLVATLMDSVNARWADPSLPSEAGSDLRTGSRKLLKGFAKVKFDDGAIVIIEGPSDFTLESAKSIFLRSGKLVAHIDEYAIGFMVNTPGSSIVDLGTEFGVTVEENGSSNVHMFEGQASLIAGKAGEKKTTYVLNEGLAKHVNIDSGEVLDVEFRYGKYVRNLDSEKMLARKGEDIDLSDVAGGGDGFGTGRVGYVLDPLTADFISFPQLRQRGWFVVDDVISYLDVEAKQAGPGKYQEISSSSFIDGVFVPDGGDGLVQISSKGHTFQNCPDTNNRFWGGLLNNSTIRDNEGFVNYHAMQLGGKTYGTKTMPGIFMHANIGITFDLDMIREIVPGEEIAFFRSLCGVTDIEGVDSPQANFYVLVDGQVRFEKIGAKSHEPVNSINVRIDDNDRFLTLVTTDTDGNNSGDHCIFASPRLEMARR